MMQPAFQAGITTMYFYSILVIRTVPSANICAAAVCVFEISSGCAMLLMALFISSETLQV
jgi:hypothetical protein